MADLKRETADANKSLECKKIQDSAHYDYDGSNDVKTVKMLSSPARLSVERSFESADSDSKRGSTLAFENNSKCNEADMQSSSVGVGQSEISTKTYLVDMKTTQRNLPTAAEDGSSSMVQDSQHRAESSCSNSLPIPFPASFSNQSYQETSKEGHLFRNCGSSMDSSNSKTFDRSPEEPVTASSESGASAQIASKARRSMDAGAKYFSLSGNHSSLMIIKGERETSHKWDLEAAAPQDGEVLKKIDNVKCEKEENVGTFGKVSISSDNADNVYCTRRDDSLPTSHFGERMIKHEVFSMKDKSPVMGGSEVVDKYKDGFGVNESADSSMTKHIMESVKVEDKVISGFDLNEDFNANDQDDCVKPVFASVPSHSVIHVVAKAGIPSGQPRIPLKFEGGLGWKGTAQTSAFHPASLSKNSDEKTFSTNHRPKNDEGFAGIDLNVAVEEDFVSPPSVLQDSHLEVDQKQRKSPWIDLNCICDGAEEFTQPSILPKSEISPLVDLNLDTNVSVLERSNNVHWLSQASQFLGNRNSDFPNPGTREFSFPRNVYMADLSTMHQMANNPHTLMASPHIVQRMELLPRVASHTLPPHSYYAKDFLPSRFYQEHGIYSEAMNPGSVRSFYSTPHPTQFVHEQSSNSSNFTPFLPKFEAKTEDHFSESGIKIGSPRFFPSLSKESQMGENMHREAWYAASSKRKEPEGGLECLQLGYHR